MRALAISNASAFSDPHLAAETLTEQLRTWASDRHLRVNYYERPHVAETHGETVREQSDRREHCRRIGFGIAGVELTECNIGVVRVREFVEVGLSVDFLQAAMRLVSGCDGLVFDLRECRGGDPQAVALVCSHLVKQRTALSSIHPRCGPVETFIADPTGIVTPYGGLKPLAIAVANYTFSGAEMFAYDLQAVGRATIIGETTGGGAHACAFHWPTPHFALLLPEAQPINPTTGTNWEGRGVTPDVRCEPNDAVSIAITSVAKRAQRA